MVEDRDSEVLSGQAMADRYQFLAKLGSGGMAEVFLGIQRGEQSFRRLVVIKKIREQFLGHCQAQQMFVDEARTAATLSHPHIVKIFDLNRHGNDLCIAMEYVDGESLNYLLKSMQRTQGRLPLDIVAKLMVEACDALEYAHMAQTPDGEPLNLVHRDISPHNLMLDGNGYLKIIDFGIAKSSMQLEMTSPGILKGKFSYLAPDRLKYQDTDRRCDIYALGLVFFELLTRRRAIDVLHDSFDQVVNKVLNAQVPAPSSIDPSIPTAIDSIIATAICRDREQRYQTADEMGNEIRSVMSELGGLASHARTRAWFHEHFAERIAKRRQLEQQVVARERGMQAPAGTHTHPGDHTPPPGHLSQAVRTIDVSDVQLAPSALVGELMPLPAGPTLGQSQLSDAPTLHQAEPRRRIYAYGAGVLAVLVLLVAGGWHYGRLERESAALPVPKPTVVAPAPANLIVVSNPAHADVAINGRGLGSTGASGISTRVVAGHRHSLYVSKKGYEPYEIELVGEKSAVRRVVANLSPRPAPSPVVATRAVPTASDPPAEPAIEPTAPVAIPPEPPLEPKTVANRRDRSRRASRTRRAEVTPRPKPEIPAVERPGPSAPAAIIDAPAIFEATPPAAPAEEVGVEPRPAPPPPAKPAPVASDPPAAAPGAEPSPPKWLSGDGQWSGERVVTAGCGHCHDGGRRARLDIQSRSARQWRRFFRRGGSIHRGCVELTTYFSLPEINRARQHVASRSNDDETRGVAGVR